ncbi:MAG: TIGR03960 family B12-binding radical SAM protein [Eubacteriales bacterium]|nr:TIGR03960 family B12-binding radical SAM protein [Eubacteriales bacterium]
MEKVELSRQVLRQVEKPAQYLGGEWNMVEKADLDAQGQPRIHFAFCFPDIYEVGMSNLALRIIYGLLNAQDDVYCERVFSPMADMRDHMRQAQLPPFSVETQRPLGAFDIVGFTLQYELSYSTILDMLAQAGIPLWQKERTDQDPLVVAGGPCVYNPEPVADFFDLIMIGEGEEILLELLDLYRQARSESWNRKRLLLEASQIPGMYVPSLYQAHYDDQGNFASLEALNHQAPARIQKRIIKNMDQVFTPLDVLVPNIEIVHDRIFLELYRGCASGCRFCQAGMIYRPVRERSLANLLAQSEYMLAHSGYEEIGLLSLSTGDYSHLDQLCQEILARHGEDHVNLSLPSLRLDSVSMDLLDQVSTNRKSGLTFAPEAGSQAARDRINKNILKSDLLETARYAFELGWERLKLYFMLGLPGESDEDVEGIADLCYELLDIWADFCRRKQKKRRLKITVSTAIFIPKPWTPFQWEGQISLEQMDHKVKILQEKLRHPAITYQWHGYESSRIEAALAKGDRRMAQVLYLVHQAGAWLEGERQFFSYERWLQAFDQVGLDLDALVSHEIPAGQALAWDFIDPGVHKAYLLRERQRALEGETTPSCRQTCNLCGAQQFGTGICREVRVRHD